MIDRGATGCLRCYFVGTEEQFENHECFDLLGKVRQQGLNLAREKGMNRDLKDDLMFLRGLMQGISYFAESTSMGAAMEQAEDQLASIAHRVIEALDAPKLNVPTQWSTQPIPCS